MLIPASHDMNPWPMIPIFFHVTIHHIVELHGILFHKRHMVDNHMTRTENRIDDLLSIHIVIENRVHEDDVQNNVLQCIFIILGNVISITGKQDIHSLPGQ